MANPLYSIPGYGGYAARRDAIRAEDQQGLQSAGTMLTLANLVNNQAKSARVQTYMSSPEAQAAIKKGDVSALHQGLVSVGGLSPAESFQFLKEQAAQRNANNKPIVVPEGSSIYRLSDLTNPQGATQGPTSQQGTPSQSPQSPPSMAGINLTGNEPVAAQVGTNAGIPGFSGNAQALSEQITRLQIPEGMKQQMLAQLREQMGAQPSPAPMGAQQPIPVIQGKPKIIHAVRAINDTQQQDSYSEDGGQTWKPSPGSQPVARFRMSSDPAPSITQIVDPTDPTRMLSVDARTYTGGSIGSQGVLGISGREPVSAKKEEQDNQGKSALSDSIATLRGYYDTLDQNNAIVNPNKSAMSNIMARSASSGVGQFLGGVVGTNTQTVRDSINMQRPLLLQAIKQATGMSAKQMDSNAELKLWLTSATDPTKSIKSNREALDSIERKYLNGNSQTPVSPAPANPSNVPTIMNDKGMKLYLRNGKWMPQ